MVASPWGPPTVGPIVVFSIWADEPAPGFASEDSDAVSFRGLSFLLEGLTVTDAVRPATAVGDEMKLQVKYNGPLVDRGRMSALDLGPAILGLGEMVGEASRVLYGDANRIRVDVRADFAHASFGIEFYAAAVASGLIPPLTLSQLAELCGVLGFVAFTVPKGAIALFRWQRNRKIDRVERDGDEINITINDESKRITVNEYNVFINPTVRKGFDNLTKPLEQEGVQGVSFAPGTVRRRELSGTSANRLRGRHCLRRIFPLIARPRYLRSSCRPYAVIGSGYSLKAR